MAMRADPSMRLPVRGVARTPQRTWPTCCRPQWCSQRTPCHPIQGPHGRLLHTNASPAEILTDTREVLAYPTGQSVAADDHEDEQFSAGPGPLSSQTGPDVSFVSLVDGKYTVRGRLLLPASAAQVYQMLTDYGGCHRVFANIAATEALQTEDGELQVVQMCRWKFLAFSGTFRVHLGVREDPTSGTLLFSLVQSNFMRDFEGRWAVRPADAPSSSSSSSAASWAAAGTEWCEVEHQLSVVPSVPVPPPVSFYTRSIFVRQVEGILADLQSAVLAARLAEAEMVAAEASEAVLAVVAERT